MRHDSSAKDRKRRERWKFEADKDHHEDEQFSDNATYEKHPSGVLMVNSGADIHLYSPAYWQEVTIDTRPLGQREGHAHEVDKDVDWQ